MFHGSIVALVTPMQDNGDIDFQSFEQLIEWHLQQQTDAIVVLGSTGEGMTVTHEERRKIIRRAVEQVKGRCPVIAGTGTNATAQTIALTKEAMELGVDACLVVTPYYNKPTQEGLYQHFSAIAKAVPIPQILYNVPSRTACDLLPETVGRLSQISNIIGLKEATGKIERVGTILKQCKTSFDLYSGDDPSCMEFILAGGKGVISITSNAAPQLMHEMCVAALAKNRPLAEKINQQLQLLHQLQSVETNPIPIKWMLYAMGKIPAGIRLPLTWLSEQHHEKIRHALQQVGISIVKEAVL